MDSERFKCSEDRTPKTNTTKNLNCTFLRCFGTRTHPKTRLLLSRVNFSTLVLSTSLIVANRKRDSGRALVKGLPREVLRRILGYGRSSGDRITYSRLTKSYGSPRSSFPLI